MHADLIEGLVERATKDVHNTLARGGLDPDGDPEKYAEALQDVIKNLTGERVFLLEDDDDE